MKKANGASSLVTRRTVLCAAAASLIGAAAPKSLWADVDKRVGEDDPREALTAQELWAQAVEKAARENAPVFYDLEPKSSNIVPYAYKSGRNTQNIVVAMQPDVLSALAAYEVSGNKITSFYDAWLSLTTGSVAHCTYSYALIDGSRTLAVNYTATLKNYLGFSESFDVYSEFGVSGGTWMTVS